MRPGRPNRKRRSFAPATYEDDVKYHTCNHEEENCPLNELHSLFMQHLLVATLGQPHCRMPEHCVVVIHVLEVAHPWCEAGGDHLGNNVLSEPLKKVPRALGDVCPSNSPHPRQSKRHCATSFVLVWSCPRAPDGGPTSTAHDTNRM